jgi:protein ImuB
MLWACIYLPQLALDGVLRRCPAPEQPLALITGPAQRRILHSVNAAATEAGLHAGQSLTTAQALCHRFAKVDYDSAEVDRSHDFLAAWAYRYGSLVSRDLPSTLLLEVEASFKLFGPWPQLEARLRKDLTGLGFQHRIALAPNPWAARALVNQHDGMAIIQSSAPLQRALGQLPLSCSGLPDDVCESLGRMGLRTVLQVVDLPRAALGKRVGAGVLQQLDRLSGALATPLPYFQPADVFQARIEFNYDVTSSQSLLFPLHRLTDDLAIYLAGRDGGVQHFLLKLEHERGSNTEVKVGLLAAEREPGMLFEFARGRLEPLILSASVCAIELIASDLPPFVPAGRDLFDARSQQAMPWLQLRERLRARVGDDAVHGLAVRADHRPERSWQMDAHSRDTVPALSRPGWLLPQPIPLRDHRLRILAGPERIESGWWEADVRRDYYVVETSLGQRAWAYRPVGELGEFMLHGWFA